MNTLKNITPQTFVNLLASVVGDDDPIIIDTPYFTLEVFIKEQGHGYSIEMIYVTELPEPNGPLPTPDCPDMEPMLGRDEFIEELVGLSPLQRGMVGDSTENPLEGAVSDEDPESAQSAHIRPLVRPRTTYRGLPPWYQDRHTTGDG